MAIWYRGEMEGGDRSTPGGSIHDFGDGLYFTDDLNVARLYASTRCPGNAALQRVYSVDIDDGELGILLDLRHNDGWTNLLQAPQGASFTTLSLIRMANENYGRFFQFFVDHCQIDLRQYDAVIGGEYVRGGNQLCILDNNGRGLALQQRLRARFRPA